MSVRQKATAIVDMIAPGLCVVTGEDTLANRKQLFEQMEQREQHITAVERIILGIIDQPAATGDGEG